MNSREFAYWLQGVFELGKPVSFDAAQTESIRRHLAMVFLHEIDPSAGPPEVQKKLNEAHDPLGHTRPSDGGMGPLIRC